MSFEGMTSDLKSAVIFALIGGFFLVIICLVPKAYKPGFRFLGFLIAGGTVGYSFYIMAADSGTFSDPTGLGVLSGGYGIWGIVNAVAAQKKATASSPSLSASAYLSQTPQVPDIAPAAVAQENYPARDFKDSDVDWAGEGEAPWELGSGAALAVEQPDVHEDEIETPSVLSTDQVGGSLVTPSVAQPSEEMVHDSDVPIPALPQAEPQRDDQAGYAAAVSAVTDPRTDPQTLADIAYYYPDLRQQVIAHPGVYSGLLEWMTRFSDTDVAAAAAARQESLLPPQAG